MVFLCDRGYELTGSSGVVLGAEWSVTCQASDAGSASGNGNTSSAIADIEWSEEPQEFTCSSKPNEILLASRLLIPSLYISQFRD